MARDRAAVALVAFALPRGATLRLKLDGSSMFPAVRPGDVVTIQRDEISPLPGDILLYARDGALFAHRFIGFRDGRPVTQGDALPAPDGPVAEGELLGRVVLIQRGRRSFAPPRTPPAWERAVAALCRRSDLFHRFVMLLWDACRKLRAAPEGGL